MGEISGHTRAMWKATKGLLSSKKAQMAFISAAVWGLGRAGLDMDDATLAGIVAPLWLYITGQAFVDFGKGKKVAELEAAATPTKAPSE
jgi:hypothetical protein